MRTINIVDTTIYIGKTAIHEPVTVFTAHVIFALCFYFYLRLKKANQNDDGARNWGLFFMMIGFASVVGSCSHAFFYVHEGLLYKFFWLSMQIFNIIAIYFAQLATLNSVLENSSLKKLWKYSYDIQLIFALISVFTFQNFLVVVIDGALGMIPIMIIHFMYSKQGVSNSWIGFGIVVLFLSALVVVAKLGFHAYFNHLDFSHVLVMINLLLIYIGVKKRIISLQTI